MDYKHCQILKTEAGQFLLSGAKKSCGSIRELLRCYRKEALRTDGYTFQLSRGCPPSLKGQRSLLVAPSEERSGRTALLRLEASAVSHPDGFVLSDKSNLLVCRSSQGAEVPLAPWLHTHISQMVFHKIRREDLVLVRAEQVLSLQFAWFLENPRSFWL